ncbi:uncharacterized protein BX663DRAFT_503274 [Cokeromyces recurvatus]|uniref:uncharacterized protein n=1 Tax=Cokeromyces recurvatus TaxID=90255 RepID=UPI00221FDC5E|nr:uncharacterized protein BX663DRAFT_503274 [Cokeromyces recurvatus]KAI7904715.1 hypothetical protein BX663DRAFT_503274 [Cokeromyces recurvatus]
MSTVSVTNEPLPSFEPIEQSQKNLQKRKRDSGILSKNLSNDEDEKTEKDSFSNQAKSSGTITKPLIIWIGATIMPRQEEEGDIGNDLPISGAFSVYYGLNDSRNFTERVTLTQNQNLDYVYNMGVIHALQKCEDDVSTLSIHTGSQEAGLGSPDYEICNQIKEFINNRKGSTLIDNRVNHFDKSKDYQAAHKMAVEKLYEINEDVKMPNTSVVMDDSIEITILSVKDNTIPLESQTKLPVETQIIIQEDVKTKEELNEVIANSTKISSNTDIILNDVAITSIAPLNNEENNTPHISALNQKDKVTISSKLHTDNDVTEGSTSISYFHSFINFLKAPFFSKYS